MTQSVCGPRAERRLRDRRRPSPRFSQRPLGWLRWGLGSRFLLRLRRMARGHALPRESNGRLCGGTEYAPTARAATRKDGGKRRSPHGRAGRAGPAADLLICLLDLIIWAGLTNGHFYSYRWSRYPQRPELRSCWARQTSLSLKATQALPSSI